MFVCLVYVVFGSDNEQIIFGDMMGINLTKFSCNFR